MKKVVKITLVALLCAFVESALAIAKPIDITVGEFYNNPLGYNLESLSFSWKLPVRDGISQSAYQIVVSDSEENLQKSPLWDSGKVLSDK